MRAVKDTDTLEFGVRYNQGGKPQSKWFATSSDRTKWIAMTGIVPVIFCNPKHLMK
jgi:hypothetical protein